MIEDYLNFDYDSEILSESKRNKRKRKKRKRNRCWKGYRPVKGKKPFSPGSCEPVSEESLENKFNKRILDLAYYNKNNELPGSGTGITNARMSKKDKKTFPFSHLVAYKKI